MTEEIIDSDEIMDMIGETITEVTGERATLSLGLVRIHDDSFCLQYSITVFAPGNEIDHTVSVCSTFEAFDLDSLRRHIEVLAKDLLSRIMARAAENN